MTEKILEVSNFIVYYGNILALEKIALNVGENEAVGLAGSNGSGKSTLLNAITGIKKAQEGEIYFQGKDIMNLAPRDRIKLGMAFVPQENNIFPLMSVEKNLDVATHLLEKKERRDKFNYIFELFPVLKEREKQIAGSLSGGEQRMLAIAMGLASNPSLLLIDEPSIGLAPKLVSKVFDALKKIKSDKKISILVAEQNIGILDIAERIYGLDGKKVKFEETTDRLDEDIITKLYLGGR